MNVRSEVSRGGVVLLQETHIKDKNIIKSYWRGGYVCHHPANSIIPVLYIF